MQKARSGVELLVAGRGFEADGSESAYHRTPGLSVQGW